MLNKIFDRFLGHGRYRHKKTAQEIPELFFIGRDDKIRTCGLFVPNEARYRAALHPETVLRCKSTHFFDTVYKKLASFFACSKSKHSQMFQ